MDIIEYLQKGRNKLTGLAGKAEGAPRVKIHLEAKKAAKKLPNSAGSKTLKQPKFGQVAGSPSSRKPASGRPMVPHGNYVTNYWRPNTKIEYEMNKLDDKGKSKGEKGIARIRDFGSKGVRAISESGQVLHLFHHEIKGLYHPPESKKK